ncbi:MAG: hypothetical protein B7Z12_04825 [Caulobacter vibrioides]|uniref:Uncharacterized protein n=1 Tax=Caulobacter vibrioides TaxID=155892 RepID=A0A258DC88_CAUVI|nr:MAG: hypothetical protein B7Z12_04825 [Caulobacter vibrioides]
MGSKFGGVASWANIVLSVAAFAVGVAIVGKGGGAGADAIVAGAPLLLFSEGLKLAIGLCIAVQVNALSGLIPGLTPRLVGFFSAILMVAASLIGAGALLIPDLRALGVYVNPVALASVAASGIWALICTIAALKVRLFPFWLTVAGGLLPLPSLAALIWPTAGFSAFILGLLWNLGLALILGRRRATADGQSPTPL